MGQVLKIDHDEAAMLAQEWMSLTGEEIGPVLADTLRHRLGAAHKRRQCVADTMEATGRFADLLDYPRPGSDHSWLYDADTGLPI